MQSGPLESFFHSSEAESLSNYPFIPHTCQCHKLKLQLRRVILSLFGCGNIKQGIKIKFRKKKKVIKC